jgi:hypothetical protein
LNGGIKGLLHPRGEFGWAVFLLVFVPLVPLIIEGWANGTLDSSTVFLTATMYTVSHAFCAHRFWVLLLGAFSVAALLFCFGHATSAAHQMSAGGSTVTTSFTNAMYYVSFGLMAFFGFLHARQRWIVHMIELEPFFEFRHYSYGSGKNLGADG